MSNLRLKFQSKLKKKVPAVIVRYFTNGHERSIKAKKNIIASFVIKVISIFINLLLVPITIHYVNTTRYGIWLTLSAIIGWLSFFDIGLGNGLRNKFAEAIARGDNELARIYVSTTYAVLTIIVSIVLVLFLIINPLLNWAKILNTPVSMANELSLLALVVFVFFCIRFLLQLIITIITANQQPAKASFLNLLGNILSLIFIFILTKITSGSLLYLGIALSVAPVIALFLSSYWLYLREYKDFAPSLKYVKFHYAGDLMNLGVKFFIIQIAAIMFYQTNNIIIAQLFGPSEVTPYSIAFQYFSVATFIFMIIVTPYWSAFTEAFAKGDILWIKEVMKNLQLIWLGLFAFVAVLFFSSDFLIKLWVGNKVVVLKSFYFFMAIYVLINAFNGIYSFFLNGVGKVTIQLYLGLSLAIFHIPISIYFCKLIGITGIFFSAIIFGLIQTVVFQKQYKKIICFADNGIWSK